MLRPGSKARKPERSADDSVGEAWRLDQQLLGWATGIGFLVPIPSAWVLVMGLGLHPVWIALLLIVWIPLLIAINRWTVRKMSREMSRQYVTQRKMPWLRIAVTVPISLLVASSGTLLLFDDNIRSTVPAAVRTENPQAQSP